MNELVTVRPNLPANVIADGNNYSVTVGDSSLELVRDVDFGTIPGTKRPSLFKSGAERIMNAYGIEQEYELVTKIEDYETPFFFYAFKVSCFKWINGIRYHITDGYGSANTRERQCGSANPFDTSNARMKMAKKRAMVDACLSIGQLSNAFTQDVEDMDFMSRATSISNAEPDDEITEAQRRRLFGIASNTGYTKSTMKKKLEEIGIGSTTEIKVKDYDRVCELFAQKG